MKILYDPEVEKRGKVEGKIEVKIEAAISLLDLLDDETISKRMGLDLSLVKKLRKQN